MMWSSGQAFNGNTVHKKQQQGTAFKVCAVQHDPKCDESQTAPLKAVPNSLYYFVLFDSWRSNIWPLHPYSLS